MSLRLPNPPNFYSQSDQSAARAELEREDALNAKNNANADFNHVLIASLTVSGVSVQNGPATFGNGITVTGDAQFNNNALVSGNFTFSALTPPASFTINGVTCGRIPFFSVLSAQAANTAWLGPVSGAAAFMTARAIQMVDLPDYTELGVPDSTITTVANNAAPKLALGKVLSLAANEAKVGDCYRLTCRGVYGDGLAAPNIQLDVVDIGGSVVVSTGTNAVGATSLTNRGWEVVVDFICTAVGAVAGRLEAQGVARLSTSAIAAQIVDMENSALATFNTTIANSLQLVVTWGTAAAANTISCRQTIWEKLAA